MLSFDNPEKVRGKREKSRKTFDMQSSDKNFVSFVFGQELSSEEFIFA